MGIKKTYTFEGVISMMTYSDSGKLSGKGETEEEAREDAITKVCRAQQISRNCVRIIRLVSVK